MYAGAVIVDDELMVDNELIVVFVTGYNQYALGRNYRLHNKATITRKNYKRIKKVK